MVDIIYPLANNISSNHFKCHSLKVNTLKSDYSLIFWKCIKVYFESLVISWFLFISIIYLGSLNKQCWLLVKSGFVVVDSL